jgi:hypothetical protein
VNLSQFETALGNELGLDTTNEKTTIDDAINRAVQRVVEENHCYVKEIDYSGWDGTSVNYTLDSAILEILEVTLTSTGIVYPLERLSIEDMLERRRTGQQTGSPTRFYSVQGANLLMFYPAPGTGDTLTTYVVPLPTALANPTDDPSSTSFAGVPEVLHEAIFLYAASKLASYDDDQSSAQGQRYRDWYNEELTRYKTILRKRGGTRNARAVVNDKRRRRLYHDNSIYPSNY